jgi:hypothetical protein
LHRYRRLLARRDAGEDGSGFAFGIRLFATVALSFALVGITGYVLLERDLAHLQVSEYAESQRADAKAFERQGTRATDTADGISDIERLLEGVEQRTGTWRSC